VAGAEYVLCAAGGKGFFSAEAVDNLGVGNLIDAVKAVGCCKRFVLVSGSCTHPSNKYHPARVVLNTFVRWRTVEHKFAGEERVVASGLPYTIIKPPVLTNEPAGQFQLHMEADATRECPIGVGTGPYSVSRADVAAVCVEALLRPSAANKRVSVYKQRCKMVAQPLSPGPGALETELQRAFESVGL
jgi:dTDP-4-dehydrorhamnose reductase